MKSSMFAAIALLMLSIGAMAQIPNNGFENWTAAGNCMKPDGWYCTNDFSDTTGTVFNVTRSTDHYPASVGNYSIRIENNTALSSWLAMGIAWTGDINGSDNPVFPVTGHPTSLRGYYKFLPQNNDSMDIHFLLYLHGVEVTQGGLRSPATVASWTPFNIQVSDTSYASADSARIMMVACSILNPHGNSVLYVDNLSFDSLITGVQGRPAVAAVREFMAEASPNPSSHQTTFKYQLAQPGRTVLVMYNALGQAVKTLVDAYQQPGSYHANWDNRDDKGNKVAAGIYFYHISSGAYTAVKRLVVLK